MRAKGKVSLKWQIIFIVLPITIFNLGGFWASYRIKKLRKFVLVFILLLVGFIIYDMIVYDESFYDEPVSGFDILLSPYWYYFHADTYEYILILIIEDIVWYGTLIFFIKRWSEQWNNQF